MNPLTTGPASSVGSIPAADCLTGDLAGDLTGDLAGDCGGCFDGFTTGAAGVALYMKAASATLTTWFHSRLVSPCNSGERRQQLDVRFSCHKRGCHSALFGIAAVARVAVAELSLFQRPTAATLATTQRH